MYINHKLLVILLLFLLLLYNYKLPGVVVAVVVKRISNFDLSPLQSYGSLCVGGYMNRKHFMGFAQVQSPPGVEVVGCVTTRRLFPDAGTIPVYGIICNAYRMQRRLGCFSLECQVLSCTKHTVTNISTNT